MRRLHCLAGHSLIELLYALLILSVVASIAANSLTQARDHTAVRSAATLLVSELSRVRSLAIVHGGARAVIDVRGGRVLIVNLRGAPITSPLDVGRSNGVKLTSRTQRDTIVLHYDARGLGRIANASLELERGSARAGVVVSAYGRARQW